MEKALAEWEDLLVHWRSHPDREVGAAAEQLLRRVGRERGIRDGMRLEAMLLSLGEVEPATVPGVLHFLDGFL